MKTAQLTTCFVGVALIAAVMSCSTSPTGPVSVPVDMAVRFRPTALTTLIDNAVLRIVYLGTADTTFERPTVARGAIDDTLTLQPGSGVELYLTARMGEEVVLYEGYDTVDVIAGGRVTSEIFMQPVASILRPTPLFQEISLAGEQEAAVGVDVFNVTNLFGASFRVEYDTARVSVASVEAGAFLGTDVFFFSYPQQGYVAISITRRQPATDQIGGVSGSGRLATIFFAGKAAGTCPLRFDVERVSLTDPDGQAVPEMSQMYFETGEIVVSP